MRFSKEKMAGSGNRKRPYGLLLLLALGMAVMCVVVLHQLREGRVLALQLQEREQQLLNLQILMQKERESLKEMRRKLDDMKAKTFTLKNHKMELTDKPVETRSSEAQLKKLKAELEAALVEKQIQVDKLIDKTKEFMLTKLEVANLTVLLKQREAEVEEMKESFSKQALVVNSTAQYEKSQHGSFSNTEERKAEWEKFQTNKDEVGLKAENVSSINQQEAEKKINYAKQNQTVSVKEVNGVEDSKGGAKLTEEMSIQMRENESNSIEKVEHKDTREIDEQFKSPEGSKLAAKNESETAVIGIARDDKMIGSSSSKLQHDLTEKTQVVEAMKNFSLDNKSTRDSESSDRKFSISKKEMKGNDKVRDNMGDGKKYKPKEDQIEMDDENSDVKGQSSSSEDLMLQENNNSEVIQSSQENERGATESLKQ